MTHHQNLKPTYTGDRKGVTIVELSVVISVILLLISVTTFSTAAYRNWTKGLEAGEVLKGVYQAQKLYLADNPTKAVSSITAADIIPYLPNGATTMPKAIGKDDQPYEITVNVSPPVMTGYTDPSGSTDDSLWDAGK